MADVAEDLNKQLENVETEFAALGEKFNTLQGQRSQIDRQMQEILDRQKQLQGAHAVLAPYKEEPQKEAQKDEPTTSEESEQVEKAVKPIPKKK